MTGLPVNEHTPSHQSSVEKEVYVAPHMRRLWVYVVLAVVWVREELNEAVLSGAS